jgi:hypothetical protein
MAARAKRPRGQAKPKAPAAAKASAAAKAPAGSKAATSKAATSKATTSKATTSKATARPASAEPKTPAKPRTPASPDPAGAPAAARPEDQHSVGLRLAAAAEAVEAVGLCVATVLAAVATADGKSYRLANGILLTLIAFCGAAGLAAIAVGLAKARPWSRVPAGMTQLFVVIAAIALLEAHRPEWGVPALVLAGTCVAGLLTPASLRALNRQMEP